MTFESVHMNRLNVFNVQFKCMPRVIKNTYLKKVFFSRFILLLLISKHVSRMLLSGKYSSEKFYISPKLDLEN